MVLECWGASPQVQVYLLARKKKLDDALKRGIMPKAGGALFPIFWWLCYFNCFCWLYTGMYLFEPKTQWGKCKAFISVEWGFLKLSIWQILNNLYSEVNDYRHVKFLNSFCCVCHLRHIALLSARFTASPWWIRRGSSLSPVLKRTWNVGVHGLSWNKWDIGVHTSQRDGVDIGQKQESGSA